MAEQMLELDFSNALEALRTNTRSIMRALAMYCGDYEQYSDTIRTILIKKLDHASGEFKLNLFYFIDFLTKNLELYRNVFSDDLIALYLSMYSVKEYRQKLLKMLETLSGVYSDELIGDLRIRMAQSERAESAESAERLERAERSERAERLERAEKSERAERAESVREEVRAQPVVKKRKEESGHAMLYSDQSLQCRVCGFRYPDSALGKERMACHLDYHFRVNKRLNDMSKKSVYRSSFLPETQWCASKEKLEETVKDSSEKYVAANLSTSSTCYVCQEKLELQWSTEREQWEYLNTETAFVDSKLIVCHTTCSQSIKQNR